MPIRGSTSQCLADYLRHFPDRSATELMAEFCDSHYRTALGWLRGEPLPKGLRLVKLRVFLQFVGYNVTDVIYTLNGAEPLSQLVALNLATVDEVRDELAYTKDDAVFRILHGEATSLTEGRGEVLLDFVNQHQAALEPALATARASIQKALPVQPWTTQPSGFPVEPDPVVSTPPVQLAEPTIPSLSAKLIITLLASYLSAAKPLADLLDSDEYTEADRTRLRAIVGDTDFFELTNVMHRLSGPRARRIYPQGGHE
jgi:hypothetical protein